MFIASDFVAAAQLSFFCCFVVVVFSLANFYFQVVAELAIS